MHRCEFCHGMFKSRPQVKQPRACKKCQPKRQRANEKAWHFKNKEGFDLKYHRLKKGQRMNQFWEKAKRICHFVEVGQTFLENKFCLSGLEQFLFRFLASLGIRRVNKLWSDL